MKKIIIVLLALFLSSCYNHEEDQWMVEKIENYTDTHNVVYLNKSDRPWLLPKTSIFKVGDIVRIVLQKVEKEKE